MALLFLSLTACASVAPAVTTPLADPTQIAAESRYQQEASLQRLRQLDDRVAAVSFRLSRAGVELCPVQAPLSGLVLHHALQYGLADRPAALALWRMGGRPAVLAVAPDGPAAAAGVRVDDQLVAVNGVPVEEAGGLDTAAPTYAATQAAQTQLDAALSKGAASLDLMRNGHTVRVTLQPVAGCGYPAELQPSDDINARADGRRVFIASAYVRYAASDDQLALILSHELAHNLLQHRARITGAGLSTAVLGDAGASRDSRLRVEREADYVGLYLMARAGYDYHIAVDFWRQIGADFGRSNYASDTHPGSLERAVTQGRTVAEIDAKRASGAPLVPTPAT